MGADTKISFLSRLLHNIYTFQCFCVSTLQNAKMDLFSFALDITFLAETSKFDFSVQFWSFVNSFLHYPTFETNMDVCASHFKNSGFSILLRILLILYYRAIFKYNYFLILGCSDPNECYGRVK